MNDELKAYSGKRNLAVSGEPEGRAEKSGGQLRFVVQHHSAKRDHFDFRLEWDGALLSWAVPKGPSYSTLDKRLAVRVENHPVEYRNFEGTIPKGEYGGGAVMLWDEGFWLPHSGVAEGLEKGALKFELKGRRLRGNWALVRMKSKAGEKKENWLLLKEKDEYAKAEDGTSGFTTSIRTGRSMAEIEAGADSRQVKNPFDRADAQLSKLVASAPEGDGWLYELKYDGYRVFAYAEGGVRLVTRNGNDLTDRFSDVACSLADWAAGRAMVLDGEMAVTDACGRTDFQALQSYMKKPAGKSLTYIVFDLLALDGEDLRGRPLIERKKTLEALMKGAPKNLYYSPHVKGNGKESFAAACQANMEGIVGKKADSVYSGTRNGDWIKLKCGKHQEFVVGGYTLSDKKTSGISSLLLGVYEKGKLVYAGRAGTGLSADAAKELGEKFEGLIRKDPPFRQPPKPRSTEKFTWLEPELVAEIRFAEWTEENLLRQASFKGLRSDKDPGDIVKEGADGEAPACDRPAQASALEKPMDANDVVIEGIRITHPDKVIFEDPPVTKADVVRYYAAVSGRMLPYVGRRVLSIVRCPKGIGSSCFFKKHPGPDSKGITTLPVTTGDGEEEDYFYIENASGLIYEAQMGTLEFHTWGSGIDNLEKPDTMVFDLDPDVGLELSKVRQGVKDLRSVLEQLSLTSFIKTSGGKGYHVVVPFKPAASWETFLNFAKRVAEVMERQWPDRYTSNVRKDRRRGRIFIDWIRNGRGATSVAPYSLRARTGARVSMPIAWEELETVAPDGIGMAEALKRVGDDPWKGFFGVSQSLK